MKYVKGNVLEQRFDEPTLIVHCCNVYDGFGSGFAGAVAKKYPRVKYAYHEWFRDTICVCDIQEQDVPFNLGKVQPVKISEGIYIVNMLGQSYPGGEIFCLNSKKIYLRPVRLDSIRECLYNVAVLAEKLGAKIVGPQFCGGLAGADFETEVEPIINEVLTANGVDITIYVL